MFLDTALVMSQGMALCIVFSSDPLVFEPTRYMLQAFQRLIKRCGIRRARYFGGYLATHLRENSVILLDRDDAEEQKR